VRLLVTRPEPDAQRTAAALRRRGHKVDLAPLLQIEALADVELGSGPWSALVLTSRNALDAVDFHPRRAELLALRVFAVGRSTAAAARAAGFGDVVAAGGNVADLVQHLRGWTPEAGASRGPVLYLAGQDRSGDLAGDLTVDGQIVATAVVYRAVKLDGFPPTTSAALAAGQIDGVLHFSRRSAQAYIDCARAAGILDRALAPVHFCLSDQIAEPLLAAGAKNIRIAVRPEESALIALIDLGA
jgi:uroporphyrinogen-III synthase